MKQNKRDKKTKNRHGRQIAMAWWNELPFEEKFYKTIEANSELIGDTVDNHPDRLTGREIQIVYNYHKDRLVS